MSTTSTPLFPKGWFLVFPGSEKLDLGDKRCVAAFEFRSQAEKHVALYWPGFGYIEEAL